MDFAQIILSPFVWLLTFFYNLFGSYGLTRSEESRVGK